jgi:hypothetical protein
MKAKGTTVANPSALSTPKQSAITRSRGWYRYYAGYSPDFVVDALRIVEANRRLLHVLDPWVGAGTTSAIAVERGHSATGVDIIPALVVIAKARMLKTDVRDSLDALTEEIIEGAHRNKLAIASDEPLLNWFGPRSAGFLRSLERSIFRLLVSPGTSASFTASGLHHLSALAAFFYVALFRVTRLRLRSATTSNPTWIKASVPPARRAKPSEQAIHSAFRSAQQSLSDFLGLGLPMGDSAEAAWDVLHGSSTSLNIPNNSIDVIITSPPYCTRIDYVASVRPELAVLGYNDESLKTLRHMTLGSPAVPRGMLPAADISSPTATRFLRKVKAHPSKASAGYYCRYFETYFAMLDRSLSEMHRVSKAGAPAFLVLQDSYYKEIRLDLPRVAAELASTHGWGLEEQFNFPVERTMAVMNPRVRERRKSFQSTESVLLMMKGVA